jgi:hypothetical protein
MEYSIFNSDASFVVAGHFNDFVRQCSVTPIEYLVWHGLVIACVDTTNSEESMIAVSVTDVSNRISLHREQVRRALSKLREKGLARNMSGQWVFTDEAFKEK